MIQTLLSGQLFLAAVVTGTVYSLVALGLNMVYGTMRLLNVAHGDLLMVGAYVALVGFGAFGLSPLLGALLGALLAGGIGALLYAGPLRLLFKTSGGAGRLEPNSLLVFVGVSVILENVVALAFTATPRGFQYMSQVYTLGGATITGNRLVAFVIAATICAATLLFLRFTTAGLVIKALIQHREAAAVVGIDVGRVQLWSVCAGFAIAGIAGGLISMTEQISPFMGFPFTIAAFVVVILGGLGNIPGGIIAGLVLGFVQTYGVVVTSESWASILLYGVFVAVLLIRPEGLLSRSAAR